MKDVFTKTTNADKDKDTERRLRALVWTIDKFATGSCKSILCVMEDLPYNRLPTPQNSGDWLICHNLFKAVPEYRERLDEMVDADELWEPYVEAWQDLETVYEKMLEYGDDAAKKAVNLIITALQ